MYAVIGRVKIKPGHEEETRSMIAEHGVAMIRGMAGSAGAYYRLRPRIQAPLRPQRPHLGILATSRHHSPLHKHTVKMILPLMPDRSIPGTTDSQAIRQNPEQSTAVLAATRGTIVLTKAA
jgi:hypothetical protein